jgi:hypothetical protein
MKLECNHYIEMLHSSVDIIAIVEVQERKFGSANTQKDKPGSSVSMVSGYGLDDWEIEVRSPAEAKGFFL